MHLAETEALFETSDSSHYLSMAEEEAEKCYNAKSPENLLINEWDSPSKLFSQSDKPLTMHLVNLVSILNSHIKCMALDV